MISEPRFGAFTLNWNNCMLYASSVYFYLLSLTHANVTMIVLIVLLYVKMAFNVEDFHFLYFWSAATNALIFWELLHFHNALYRFHKVTQGYWIVKFIHLLPQKGKWREVSVGLREQVTNIRGYGPFTYRGLVEFLVMAEEVLEEPGGDPRTHQASTRQLIHDMLLEPAGQLEMPNTLVEPNAFEQQQMRRYEEECPEVELCRRMDTPTLWYRWTETKGLEYPHGLQGTWTRILELVVTMPRIESANTNHIAALLASPTPPSSDPVFNLRPLAVVSSISSGSSNSVMGPLRQASEEDQE